MERSYLGLYLIFFYFIPLSHYLRRYSLCSLVLSCKEIYLLAKCVLRPVAMPPVAKVAPLKNLGAVFGAKYLRRHPYCITPPDDVAPV